MTAGRDTRTAGVAGGPARHVPVLIEDADEHDLFGVPTGAAR